MQQIVAIVDYERSHAGNEPGNVYQHQECYYHQSECRRETFLNALFETNCRPSANNFKRGIKNYRFQKDIDFR